LIRLNYIRKWIYDKLIIFSRIKMRSVLVCMFIAICVVGLGQKRWLVTFKLRLCKFLKWSRYKQNICSTLEYNKLKWINKNLIGHFLQFWKKTITVVLQEMNFLVLLPKNSVEVYVMAGVAVIMIVILLVVSHVFYLIFQRLSCFVFGKNTLFNNFIIYSVNSNFFILIVQTMQVQQLTKFWNQLNRQNFLRIFFIAVCYIGRCCNLLRMEITIFFSKNETIDSKIKCWNNKPVFRLNPAKCFYENIKLRKVNS